MSPDREQTHKWQNIIWREWRNCQHNLYAKQLFELVADTRVGWGTRLTYMLFDAVFGMALSILLGFLANTGWDIMRQLVLAGGVVGAMRGFLASQQLLWRDWLARLAFALPTARPNSHLGAVLFLLLLATVIFGPLLWLLVIGFFWGMSGLIQWMTKEGIGGNAVNYYAWYYWWRKRPSIDQVEAALEWAATVDLPQRPATLPQANHPIDLFEPSPVQIDFLQLKHYAQNRQIPPTPEVKS